MATEAQKKASRKYDEQNTVQIKLKLNRNTDADIIECLSGMENKQGFIKELIREYMAEHDAMKRMDERTRECESKLSGMTLTLIDGYRDENAIKTCMEEDHTIYVGHYMGFEYRVDVDARKLLTCIDLRNPPVEP